ncbi:MAG: exodeoxyribonuclease VII small subunit [candidate division Zixibacteria bacterium]|nr:exodeoxyribonuclease VII small subunit [candidate division Zixibacteria bacterium]
MTKQPEKFEDAFARLSAIVSQLEAGETGLEESLQLYAEGMKLVQFCGLKLTEAEKKIEQLTSENTAPGAEKSSE